MSFFQKICSAFAIGAASNGPDDNLVADDPDVPESQPRQMQSAAPDIKGDNGATAIFEHVIATFNTALPDFLQRSVNPEAQKQVLYQSLNDDLKKYLADVAERSRQLSQEKSAAALKQSTATIHDLEHRLHDLDEKRNELTAKQLSTDRQRRALSERVHDLEKQVLTLEAEREQFQIENRSLVNKIKAAGVVEGDIAQLREDNRQLRQQLDEARQATQIVAEPTVTQSQLKEIEDQLAQFEDIIAKKDRRIADLTNTQQQLRQQIAQLKKQGRPKKKPEPAPTPMPDTPIDDILSDTDWLIKTEPKHPKQPRADKNQRPGDQTDALPTLF